VEARRWLELADGRELDEYGARIFDEADEGRLRRMLKRDPKLHPAAFELASRAIREGRDVKKGLDLARAALDSAPPIVANSYLATLGPALESIGQRNDAAALRVEYAAKLRAREAARRQLY
jgi:hypothetical protein